MIFISHNYKDKPFVEHIASQLSSIYGRDKVFYDSWSIQPGDGIIDKMNDGLSDAKFFFFFVTENSLKSKMVSLEWQNALMHSASGRLKFIPIKSDESTMPALLTQSLYLNLYNDGVDAVIAQMKNIIDNENTFKPIDTSFSNLSYDYKNKGNSSLTIHISANHFLEPIAEFLIGFNETIDNEQINCLMDEHPFISGFNKGYLQVNGTLIDAQLVKIQRGITIKMPLVAHLSRNDNESLSIIGVMHRVGTNEWVPIPRKHNPKLNSGKTFETKF